MIDKLEQEDPDAMTPQQIQCLADKLDKEKTEFEICSDNTCRKKKDGKLPWTDYSGAWWNRRRVYYRLVKFHKGRPVSMKSLEVACKQNKIPHPRQTTLQYCYEGIKRCNDKIKEYTPVAWPKRR